MYVVQWHINVMYRNEVNELLVYIYVLCSRLIMLLLYSEPVTQSRIQQVQLTAASNCIYIYILIYINININIDIRVHTCRSTKEQAQ